MLGCGSGESPIVVAPRRPWRYAITDLSSSLSDSPAKRRLRLEEQLLRWAVDGVDTVQLREKHLNTGELFALAAAAQVVLGSLPQHIGRPRLLINSRLDIALATGADGVHLSAAPGALTPAQTRAAFTAAGKPRCLVSISCHTLGEVARAGQDKADLILFGPVFEKRVAGKVVVEGKGLPLLRDACLTAAATPVLALGGVNPERVAACLEAGAAGFASIRAFA